VLVVSVQERNARDERGREIKGIVTSRYIYLLVILSMRGNNNGGFILF